MTSALPRDAAHPGKPRTRHATRAPALLLSAVLTALACDVRPQSLDEAFAQGTSLGRSGNAAARATLNPGTLGTTLPAARPDASQSALFGSPGLTQQARARATACASAANESGAAPGAADPTCSAIEFSQTNPSRAPRFGIATNDPLIVQGRTIAANPRAIGDSLVGHYSGCSVRTTTGADRFERASCHQYRGTETASCDRRLIVSPVLMPGCSDGQFLTRASADPCPECIDYLAFDFSCAAQGYRMHLLSIDRETGSVYMDLGSQIIPGSLNTEIPRTQGLSNTEGQFCYQTFYSQSCDGEQCGIGVWFTNPCRGLQYEGQSRFTMPTQLRFVDSWDDQCAALEARAR
jgi:hypothetical protein